VGHQCCVDQVEEAWAGLSRFPGPIPRDARGHAPVGASPVFVTAGIVY
jgi:hypothetical protein